MTIPDFQTIMLPLLKALSDQKKHHLKNVVKALADKFELTGDELAVLLPSGRTPLFYNRVGWSRLHLKNAGLIESPERGYLVITPRGMEVLSEKPDRIDKSFLMRIPQYKKKREAYRAKRRVKSTDADEILGNDQKEDATPEEVLEVSFNELQEALVSDILDALRSCSPAFFERLVIDVLIQMGYGGSRKEAGQAVGGSGDGGIDGIIKEDKLGLDIIYLQAKRWDGTVGRPEIQKFAGALQGQRARKGIFITTAAYSKEARDYVHSIDSKIILIDGRRLAELMIAHNVGVGVEATYEVKKIDSDYFL